jgi:hypothetical protein
MGGLELFPKGMALVYEFLSLERLSISTVSRTYRSTKND